MLLIMQESGSSFKNLKSKITNWKFLRLIGNQIEIDLKEYYLSEIDQILGILKSAVQNQER